MDKFDFFFYFIEGDNMVFSSAIAPENDLFINYGF